MSVRNGLAVNMVPPGGFHYLQALKNGSTHRIEGSSWEELERQVLSFRLEQIVLVDPERADPDSVSQDIHDYVCAHFPHSCVDRHYTVRTKANVPVEGGFAEQEEDQTFRRFVPLISRIAEWLGQLDTSPTGFTTPAVADARAKVCAHCPQNVRWETTCGPCVANVRKQTTNIVGTRSTRLDAQLAGCRRLGWYNRIAVWLDLEKVYNHNLPDNCWHKL